MNNCSIFECTLLEKKITKQLEFSPQSLLDREANFNTGGLRYVLLETRQCLYQRKYDSSLL